MDVGNSPAKKSPPYPIWRWVFIVANTFLFATMATLTIERSFGWFPDYEKHRLAISILADAFVGVELFLIFVSPFFFRRLSGPSKCGFSAAIIAIIWAIMFSGRA